MERKEAVALFNSSEKGGDVQRRPCLGLPKAIVEVKKRGERWTGDNARPTRMLNRAILRRESTGRRRFVGSRGPRWSSPARLLLPPSLTLENADKYCILLVYSQSKTEPFQTGCNRRSSRIWLISPNPPNIRLRTPISPYWAATYVPKFSFTI